VQLKSLGRKIQEAGILKSLGDYALRAINRIMLFKILKAVKIETVDPAFLTCDERFEGMFLNPTLLSEFASNPIYELTPEFLAQAFAKGDECYGFIRGDVLASYGWYSDQPTDIDVPGIEVTFDPQYVYMYKAFTEPHNRGHRLHAAGVTRALESFLSRGYKGLVSYVEWNNFSSLKSSYRMGYHDFGIMCLVRLLNRYFIWHSTGCQRCNFRAQVTRAPRSTKPANEHTAWA
jgi:hypothetical protein